MKFESLRSRDIFGEIQEKFKFGQASFEENKTIRQCYDSLYKDAEAEMQKQIENIENLNYKEMKEWIKNNNFDYLYYPTSQYKKISERTFDDGDRLVAYAQSGVYKKELIQKSFTVKLQELLAKKEIAPKFLNSDTLQNLFNEYRGLGELPEFRSDTYIGITGSEIGKLAYELFQKENMKDLSREELFTVYLLSRTFFWEKEYYDIGDNLKENLTPNAFYAYLNYLKYLEDSGENIESDKNVKALSLKDKIIKKIIEWKHSLNTLIEDRLICSHEELKEAEEKWKEIIERNPGGELLEGPWEQFPAGNSGSTDRYITKYKTYYFERHKHDYTRGGDAYGYSLYSVTNPEEDELEED